MSELAIAAVIVCAFGVCGVVCFVLGQMRGYEEGRAQEKRDAWQRRQVEKGRKLADRVRQNGKWEA